MPFSAAALIAISRSMDYRHHWHDILVGSILGTVLAFFSYRQYYPSLSSELSHRPYSPRIKEEDTNETSNGQGSNILPLHLGAGTTPSGFKTGSTTSLHANGPLNNRYNTTPSPPIGQQQGSYVSGYHAQQGSGASGSNPFVHPTQHAGSQAEASYELDGTAPRPGGGHGWTQGSGVEGTVPRTRDGPDADDAEDAYGGYQREMRSNPQQHQQTSGLA